MGTVVKDRKVSDMTAGELQELIRQTIQETIDPDFGLDLKPEIKEELKESLQQKARGEGMPLEEVKTKLGL